MSDSALTHETAGTTDEAIAAMMPRLEAAIAVSVAGKLEEADQQLRLLLSEQPDNLYILNALGSNSARLGKISEAAHFLELVVSRDPKNAGAHNNLGNLHKIAGNRDAAIASYSRSIELQPGYAEAHYNLGISLAEAGRRDEAIESYERALMFNPAYPEAHNNLATLMLERGDFEQATTHFRQALIWNPDLPQATLNLAFSLTRLGEFAESNEIYQGLLAANPRDIDVQKSFAVALAQQGRHEEALAMLEQVVADQPDSADAWANLGSIYHMSRRFEDAVRCFDETLRLRPLGTSPVHQLIGNSLLEQGAVDESLERFQHAAMLNPQAATANGNYANTLRATGRIAEAVKSLKKCAEAAPDNAELLSNLIYTLHFDPQRTPAERFEAARLWAKRFENTETEAVPHIIATEQRDRPIRVGLVSGDLRDHSVAYFLRPLLENHERGQISLFAYNTSLAPLDAVSHRFKEQVEHWREIGALSDPVAIDMIRRDSVDILIDLSVHTADNRLSLFAKRAAPIQISWLGFFASSGLSKMDYRLSDALMDPPGTTEAWHSETLLRLPTLLCYAPPQAAPDITPLPMLGNGYPTFAALHNYAKLNGAVFDAYADILGRIPNARLLISSGAKASETAQERVYRQFALRDIDRERIEVIPNLPFEQYLHTLQRADIALDSFPYPGGVTTMHCLWMGLPVVSLAGSSSYERVGASLLTAAGLAELVCSTRQEYVERAVSLTSTASALSTLRNGLRERLHASPLLDGKTYARQFEQLLREVWHQYLDRLGK